LKRRRHDKEIFAELIRPLDQKEKPVPFPDQLMVEIGRFFVGTPYRAGTLEVKGAEHLVVNLKEFDCFTFVENVTALVFLLTSSQSSFDAFRRVLRKIRYRQGRVQGYPSRLHYFSDWIHDNQKKGFIRDVTAEVGGRPLRKALTFMTAHPGLYPPLKNATNLRRMKSVERAISKRFRNFIPNRAVRGLEDRIRDGDLIAITTNTEGLDVQHVGLAVRVKHRIHLLHASSVDGKVVLSRRTLCRYLTESNTRSGIIVARIAPSA
jgi:cell wall-associated NlpC family hydrolase